MAVSENKGRITIALDKDIVEEVRKIAVEENRTVSQQINYVLKNWLKKED